MKSKVLFFPLMIIFLSLVSCNSKSEIFSEYKCPMDCEKKTYDKAGICPVCKMDLEGVPSKN